MNAFHTLQKDAYDAHRVLQTAVDPLTRTPVRNQLNAVESAMKVLEQVFLFGSKPSNETLTTLRSALIAAGTLMVNNPTHDTVQAYQQLLALVAEQEHKAA